MPPDEVPAARPAPVARVTVEQLVAALPDGVTVLDPEGRYTYASDRAATVLGLASAAELVGKRATDVVGPACHDHLKGCLQALAAEPFRPTPHAYLVRRAGGADAWIELTATPIRDAVGAVTGVLGVVRDITARKHAAEATRARDRADAAHRQQRAVLEQLPVGVAIVAGAQQRITYVNPKLVEMFGYTVEMVPYASDFRRLAHPDPDDRATIERDWAKRKAAAARTGAPIEPMNLRVTARDGTARFVRAHLVLLGDEQVSTFVDLTDRHRYELALTRARDEAESANRAKSDFLATMSHELRTPLNAILGFSETLSDGVLGELNERQRHGVLRIEQGGRLLLSLISDLLDFSRIEAGRMEVEIAAIDLRSVCEASLHLVHDAAEKKGLRTALSVDRAPPAIRTDERRLTQILVNLLGNAVKFTPTGGSVGLDVEHDEADAAVRFIVWDTGIGISIEDRDRLFRPFVQVDSSSTRRFEGTGLGLAIVSRLSALLGGDVAVESEPGKGSRFTVTLPVGD